MSKVYVRSLQEEDYDQWLPVWQENMQHQVSDEVTRNTWLWLCNSDNEVSGFGVFENSDLAGIMHYILHPTTGSMRPVCYMQDLFIMPDYRRKGYAKELLRALAQMGQENGWERIYWIAARDNEYAQKLYRNIGIKLDFTMHVLPLNLDLKG